MLALFILIVAWLAVTAPLSKSLQPIAAPQLTLLAADGTPIARNGAVIDKPVDIEKLPPHVVEAFLAIEDRRFYSHWGIDPRGLARAAWTGFGGGSTITQQLAKFTFLTPEQTLTRKGREMLIAFWLEAWLTKDEILERYLSNAYFGDNVYGLRAASLHYFYRQPERLKLEQAMMLAGLVQAPSRFAPTKHYDRAAKRMALVKGAMVDAGYLTAAEAAALRAPGLDVRPAPSLPTGTYFADWALPQGRKLAEAGYGGQTLTTTLDSRLQSIARRATARVPGTAQVALVAMRPNGEVVAMIGGTDYQNSPFNRATQARRQPGSTFKLFVWLAALQSGMKPEDRIDNRPIVRGGYRPKNAGASYSDSITLEEAFARSSNVAAVRLLQTVGSESVIASARDLGVRSPLAEGDPSLALGTSTMTLLELTSAYAGIAANDFPVAARAFAQPESGWLSQAWDWSKRERLSGRVHADIERMLRAAINRGTGRAASLSIANYGKTGTSQDYRDALFVGYAGDLVVGVWVGNDDNTPLNGITGGSVPARIWRDFMVQALGKGASRPAPAPDVRRDPGTPVEPMDVRGPGAIPDAEFPIDDGSRIRIGEDGVTVTTDVSGVPVDMRMGRDGLRVEPGQRSPSPSPTR
jgi:penicillin-binding protein 1A